MDIDEQMLAKKFPITIILLLIIISIIITSNNSVIASMKVSQTLTIGGVINLFRICLHY